MLQGPQNVCPVRPDRWSASTRCKMLRYVLAACGIIRKGMNCMQIGSRLRNLRLGRGLSQQQLAELSCIGQATISAIEAGKQSPTIDTLARLCAALEISLADFFLAGVSRTGVSRIGLPPHLQDLLSAAERLNHEQVCKLAAFLQSLEQNDSSRASTGAGQE